MASGIPFGMGPFSGGLNLNDPRTIAENELSLCNNFDVQKDGTLANRAGAVYFGTTAAVLGDLVGNPIKVLGVDSVGNRLIAQFFDGTNLRTQTHDLTSLNATWVNQITSLTGMFQKVLRYGGVIYYIPEVLGVGTSQTSAYAAFTAIPTMPGAVDAVIHKDRMWIAGLNSNKIYYSATTNPASWPGANFIDIGSEEPISAIVSYQDSLLIFKLNSTWRFDFSTNPGQDGRVQLVNSEIGAGTSSTVVVQQNRRLSVCIQQDGIYVMTRDKIYRYINNRFDEIGANLGVRKEYYYLYAFAKNKILLYGNIGYAIYNTDLGVWTSYIFAGTGWNAGTPKIANVTINFIDYSVFMVGQIGSGLKGYALKDTPTTLADYRDNSASGIVQPTASLTTKHYDANDPLVWKKLYWFGFEIKAVTDFQFGTPIPNAVLTASDVSLDDTVISSAGTTQVLDTNNAIIVKAVNSGGIRFRTVAFKLDLTEQAGTALGLRYTVFGGRFIVNLRKRMQKNAT